MKTGDIIEFLEQGADEPGHQAYALERLAENQAKITERVEATLSAAERIVEMAVSVAEKNADDAHKWREIGADAVVVLRNLSQYVMPNGRIHHTRDCAELENPFIECDCGYVDALILFAEFVETIDE